jgi:predicted transcriptional regulator
MKEVAMKSSATIEEITAPAPPEDEAAGTVEQPAEAQEGQQAQPEPESQPEAQKTVAKGEPEKDEIRQYYVDLQDQLAQILKDQEWIKGINTNPRMVQIMERFHARTEELKEHIAHFCKPQELKSLQAELASREAHERLISGMDMQTDVDAKNREIIKFEEENSLFISDLMKKYRKARKK